MEYAKRVLKPCVIGVSIYHVCCAQLTTPAKPLESRFVDDVLNKGDRNPDVAIQNVPRDL